jgi:predicted ATPase
LELLQTLPDGPERIQRELTLQIALGGPLMTIKGLGSPEVQKVYARAQELCRQVGETRQLFQALYGLRVFSLARAELHTALQLAEQLLSLAQSLPDPVFLIEAHRFMGESLGQMGEFVLAPLHQEQVIALYDTHQSCSSFFYGHDPKVSCLSVMAWILWCLGYPEQALKRGEEALTRAQELAHPFTLAWALLNVTSLHQGCRDAQAAQERIEMLMPLAAEQEFTEALAYGAISRGWVLVEQERVEEGIAQMQQGLAAFRSLGMEIDQPYYLAYLAEAYGKVGQTGAGLSALDEALATINKTGGRF